MERFGVVFLAVVLGFALAQGAPEPLKVEVGGQALEVEGSLVRYRFSQLGGTLESAFIHFSSYRSQAVDAVPGWTGSGEDRALAPGVSLPFEVWQGDARADEGAYRLELDQPDENTASVSLVREGVLKEFTVRTDAL
ncbi:hypothetical protein H5T52_10720, partial [Candidatus Bipolaricaulota bacterium]|nr:hypothetical protein [Candidatus Bipolaricaulota bacterium]